MGHDKAQCEGSVLKLSIDRTKPNEYQWHVAICADDHSKSRKLLYRARGVLASLGAALGECAIEVHDDNRPVWTPLPRDQRKDVRTLINALVLAAVGVAEDAGHA